MIRCSGLVSRKLRSAPQVAARMDERELRLIAYLPLRIASSGGDDCLRQPDEAGHLQCDPFRINSIRCASPHERPNNADVRGTR